MEKLCDTAGRAHRVMPVRENAIRLDDGRYGCLVI